MISDKKVEEAIGVIARGADLIGPLRGQKAYIEHHMKVVKALKFLSVQGTVAERQAVADSCDEYKDLIEQLQNCVAETETLATKFKAAELTADVWRTQQANNRRGHV